MSLLGEDAPTDAAARLELVAEEFGRQLLDHEPELRAQLRLSLENPSAAGDLPLRKGRAIAWFDEALEPLRGRLPQRELRRLVLAIRATLGIEALVWLTDVAGVSRDEAVEIMRWSARTLVAAALSRSAEDARYRRADTRTVCRTAPAGGRARFSVGLARLRASVEAACTTVLQRRRGAARGARRASRSPRG